MSDGSEHLLEQYGRVGRIVAQLERFVARSKLRQLNPFRVLLAVLSAIPATLGKRSRALSSEERRSRRRVAVHSKFHTRKEVASEFFKISISEYGVHLMSEYISRECPGLHFASLAKLHKVLRPSAMSSMPRVFLRVTAVLVGAGSLLLQTVPRQVVEQFSVNYDGYRVVVFWGMVIALVYVALVFGPYLVVEARQRRQRVWLGEVLEYLKLNHDQTGSKATPESSSD